ncbi:hypothetical protein PBSP11A_000513100 [Plasmodium berghei]|uniref:Uncharacterized protein n=1 Tax=Plasmodium berghei TaxID=5821 RepID=A0A1D3L855_PLABE|nr:hypothetical protein PBSP11A_000513100 [Plasmodium berghei]
MRFFRIINIINSFCFVFIFFGSDLKIQYK